MHNITKIPTVKLVRFGFAFDNEYRGSRTVEGIIKFVEQELKNPTKVFKDLQDISSSNYVSRVQLYVCNNPHDF